MNSLAEILRKPTGTPLFVIDGKPAVGMVEIPHTGAIIVDSTKHIALELVNTIQREIVEGTLLHWLPTLHTTDFVVSIYDKTSPFPKDPVDAMDWERVFSYKEIRDQVSEFLVKNGLEEYAPAVQLFASLHMRS
jgi:hypothetical protein